MICYFAADRNIGGFFMLNLSLLLLGITLAVVSVTAILFSASDLRNTNLRRHRFFKGIRLFVFLYLLPVFLIILVSNVLEMMHEQYLSVENSTGRVIYIVASLAMIIVTLVYVFKPVNTGILLFRKNNKDNLKYTRAINRGRNGMLFLLVLVVVTLIANAP